MQKSASKLLHPSSQQRLKSLSISAFSLIFNIHLSCSVLFCFVVAVVIVVVGGGCVGGYGGGDVCGCGCACTHTCIPPLHSHIHYILQFLLTDSE